MVQIITWNKVKWWTS